VTPLKRRLPRYCRANRDFAHGDETHQNPWMKAEDFGRSLPKGIGINLLVPEIAPMEAFLRDVLGAVIVYADEDFTAIELLGSVFMLHADHSYSDNPIAGVISGVEQRGTGIEIRVYGLDPDIGEAWARRHGHDVFAGSLDKPHGLRSPYRGPLPPCLLTGHAYRRLTDGVGRSQLLKKFRNKSDPHTQF